MQFNQSAKDHEIYQIKLSITFFLFLSPSSLSEGVSGGGARNSGPLTPTDDGADEACITLARDVFTGDVRGVVVSAVSISCDGLSFTCINQHMKGYHSPVTQQKLDIGLETDETD